MELVKKNKTFAENIVYNYLHGNDDGEDLIQYWYGASICNHDVKMFRSIYDKCELEPNDEVKGLIKEVFGQTGKKKFSDLMIEFR